LYQIHASRFWRFWEVLKMLFWQLENCWNR
jgi:hypothetical protein